MVTTVTFWLICSTLIVGMIAVIWDVRYRKIPNWLTFGAMVSGISLNLVFNWQSWMVPFLGVLAGFLMLLLPYTLGGIGAGDVKLLMGFGAFLGAKAVFWVTLYAAIAGGIFSLGYLVYKYGWETTKQKLQKMFLKLPGIKKDPTLSSNPTGEKVYIPYGVAIYAGLIWLLIAH